MPMNQTNDSRDFCHRRVNHHEEWFLL